MAEDFIDVEFTPFGEKEQIKLNPRIVARDLMVVTKTGKSASESDIRNFIALCKAQGLNPFTKDAYLVGYDTKDGPKFNLITSHQALLKRAEFSEQFDGIESGVIVFRGEDPLEADDNNTVLREGDFVHAAEFLLGGWARVFRKDRSRPFSDRIHREVFDSKQSRWEKDPAGMIVKVAEGSALRKAFPSALAGLYCQEEMEAVHSGMISSQSIGLPDNRAEQQQDKIVIPTTKAEEPEKVPVTRTDKERQELERAAAQQESVFPEPVQKLMDSAKRAKGALTLIPIKQAWLSIKGNYPEEMVATVDKFFERRSNEVTPEGGK